MTIAQRIVDFLLEEGPDDFMSDLTQRTFTYDVSPVDYTFDFGFCISVDVNEDELPEIVDQEWLSRSVRVIENNVLEGLRRMGIHMSDEGHDDHGLVGSAWFSLKPPEGLKALELMKRYLLNNHDEPFRTSSGSFPHELTRHLYDGVLYLVGRDFTDVSLEFFGVKRLLNFLELVNDGVSPEEAAKTIQVHTYEAFLGAVEPSGVFKSTLGGHTIFSAQCPGCKRKHGNFRTFEQASANKMCKFCIRSFVDKISKVRETGNFRSLLKKDHAKKRLHQ